MLAKSSKSRFAAIAIMALGVSTFMGTSAALATEVSVSGTVGQCSAPSTVAAADVDFGTVPKGTQGSASLAATISQGKNTDCSARSSNVSASIGTFTGQAHITNVSEANRVVVAIGALTGGAFPMTATVPELALLGAAFGAEVTLTLSDNS